MMTQALTQAQQWEERFVAATDREQTRQHLSSIVREYASRFESEPQIAGHALDATLIHDEFHQFDDGSVINGRSGRIVELNSPTTFEKMTPEERVVALRDLKNLGTVEHPIFATDFVREEDYLALDAAHFWPRKMAAGNAA